MLEAFKAALDAHCLVSIADVDGIITYANDHFCRVSEYERADLVGETHRIINSQFHPPEFFRDMWATIKRGDTWHGIVRNRTKRGTLYWVSSTIIPVIGRHGSPTEYMSVRTDITAQKLAEEARAQERDKAQELMQTKSSFLANMSHEIRTPMNGVIGMTQLLLDTGLDVEQRDYAETILGSAECLLTLINDILDFSKVEAGKFTLDPKPFSVSGLVERVCNLLRPKSHEKRITLGVGACSTIPELVMGDDIRIGQILLNLIGNAIKFTSEGGMVQVHASVRELEAHSRTLQFEVKDSGIGISSAHLESIFEPFSQAETSTSRRFGGTGLGLAISRQLADLMGGSLQVSSEIGRGSTFTLNIPLIIPTPSQLAALSVGKGRHRAPNVPRGMQVLVAENDVVSQKLLRKMLERYGCTVETVEDGASVIRRALESRFDIIFMDCHMPLVDGFQATAAIRSVGSRGYVPIVAVTALAMPGDREQCLDAGMTDYLSKPIEPSKLAEILERWGRGERPNLPGESHGQAIT